MVENDIKGWYGSFSLAGKDSAEKYGISKIQDLLSEKTKKKVFKDFFSPDNNYNNNINDEETHEKIDIFNSNTSRTNLSNPNLQLKKSQSQKNNIIISSLIEKIEKNNNIKKKQLKQEKFKYHIQNIIRMNKKKKEEKNNLLEEGPSLSKYTPKMDYIWSRTLSGPKWESLTSRKFKCLNNNWEINNLPKSSIEECKCLVNMEKQTMRYGFPIHHDLRFKYEKKYTPPKRNNFYLKKKIHIKNKSKNSSPKKNFFKTNILYKPNSLLCDKIKLIPDFKKTISRSKVNQIKQFEKLNSPSLIPNYSYVHERPIMMVVYDKTIYKKKKNDFKGIDSSILYNIDKVFNKYNNHKKISVPLFKDMISRSNSNLNPLPSFMKGIYNKISSNEITNKTLEMNNFENGKFFDGYNTFYPKKSFNKLINLSLLNSDKVIEELNKSPNGKIDKSLNKTINYYKANYDKYLNENSLKKFDNVTYKTIEKRNILKKRNLNHKNFSEVDHFFFE